MRRGRSTTVCFATKEAADAAPLLAKPNCDPEITTAADATLAVQAAVASLQGWRKANEDASFVYVRNSTRGEGINLPPFVEAAVGIFDGHQNASTSQFLAARLVPALCHALEPRLTDGGSLLITTEELAILADEVFHAVDLEHRHDANVVAHGGSTAGVAIVTPSAILMLSTGDCRLFAFDGGASPPRLLGALENDHRPAVSASECARIEAVGGSCEGGRVSGILSVSRAFGDFALKPAERPRHEWPVITTPDTAVIPRLAGSPVRILVGCDGLWELQGDAASVIQSVVQSASTSGSLGAALAATAIRSVAQDVRMTEAIARNMPPGCDNISVGLISIAAPIGNSSSSSSST